MILTSFLQFLLVPMLPPEKSSLYQLFVKGTRDLLTDEGFEPSLNTQSCIKGLLVVQDFCSLGRLGSRART